jgi:predicted RNase H-like nuclease (RuvC/YqgF family)
MKEENNQTQEDSTQLTHKPSHHEKAVAKLKRKCWINHQISKELSKRNVLLREQNETQKKQMEELKKLVLTCSKMLHSSEGNQPPDILF